MARKIPGIYVEIKGDSTQLRKDMKAAKQIVSDSATGMSNALNNALGPDKIKNSTNQLISNLGTLSRSSENTAHAFKNIAVDLGALQRITGTTGTQFDILQQRMLKTAAANAQVNSLKNIARAADLSEREISDLGRQFGLTDNQIKKVNASLNRTPKNLDMVNRSASSIRATVLGIGSAWLSVHSLGAISRIADDYTNIDSKLKLVTDDTEEFASVYAELFKISQETGSELVSNAKNYANLALALQDTGIESKTLLNVFNDLNRSLVVAGASTQEQSSFMLQFKQALGANRLAGDEFKAMLEANSYWAGQFAKALGTDIAGLYEMKEAGELTTQTVLDAHKKMSVEIAADFGGLQKTIGRATTEMKNAWQDVIADANRASGSTNKIAEEISSLAATVTTHKPEIITLFSAVVDAASFAVKGVAAVTTEVEHLAWRAAALSQGDYSGAFGPIEALKQTMGESVPVAWEYKQQLEEVNEAIHKLERSGKIRDLREEEEKKLATYKAQAEQLQSLIRIKEREAATVKATTAGNVIPGASQASVTRGASGMIETVHGVRRDVEAELKALNVSVDNALTDFYWQFDRIPEVDSALHDFFEDIDQQGSEAFKGFENAVSMFGSSFGTMLTDAVWGAEVSFNSIAESFARMVTEMAIQKSIIEPMLGGLFGAGGGGMGGGVLGAVGSLVSAFLPFEQGGTLSGTGISAYSNTIVDKPTFFPFAKGIGLMGEAGSEAIMPLTRMPDGDLGVKATSGGTTVQVINNSGVPATVNERQNSDGTMSIEVLIDRSVSKLVGKTGTATNKAVMSTTGASAPLVRR